MDNMNEMIDDKKRILTLILTLFIGFNVCVCGGRSVVARADVISDVGSIAEGMGGLGAIGGILEGASFSIPQVAVVAGALTAGGIIFHNRHEIMAVAGSIASELGSEAFKFYHAIKNKDGSYRSPSASASVSASDVNARISVDGKKVVEKYNKMVEDKKVTVSNVPINQIYGRIVNTSMDTHVSRLAIYLPTHFPKNVEYPHRVEYKVAFDDVNSYVTIGNHKITKSPATFLIYKKSYASSDCSVMLQNSSNPDSYYSVETYSTGEVKSVSLYQQFDGGYWGYNNETADKLHIPRVNVQGESVSVSADMPSSFSSSKSIGNDTNISIPNSKSISLDSYVGANARSLAQDKTIDLQIGNQAIARPLSDVLTVDGAIPLTQTGALDMPVVQTGTADLTFDDTISDAIDFSPIKEVGKGLTEVFPFSIPFDFVRGVKLLVAPAVAPKFDIKFDNKYFKGGGHILIDFTQFETWATIIRFFIALSFSVFVVLKTRELIRG